MTPERAMLAWWGAQLIAWGIFSVCVGSLILLGVRGGGRDDGRDGEPDPPPPESPNASDRPCHEPEIMAILRERHDA